MTGKSTNIQEFTAFIQRVIAAFKNPEDKPYLVLDNHSSHKSLQVRRLLEAHFKVCFIPTQSCELNSIESLWALLKKNFRTKAASLVGTLRNQGEIVALVESIADEIPESTRLRFCEANRKYLLKLLWQIKQGLIGDTFVWITKKSALKISISNIIKLHILAHSYLYFSKGIHLNPTINFSPCDRRQVHSPVVPTYRSLNCESWVVGWHYSISTWSRTCWSSWGGSAQQRQNVRLISVTFNVKKL